MSTARALRWTTLVLLGLGTGLFVGAQIATPVPPIPTEGVTAYVVSGPGQGVQAVRIVNDPDPWYQRNSVFILSAVFGAVGWAIRAKLRIEADKLRAEFLAEAVKVREELRKESTDREKALLLLTGSFNTTMAKVEGTIGGLDASVKTLGAAAVEMSKNATEIAVNRARVDQLEEEIKILKRTSRGYQAAHRETPG